MFKITIISVKDLGNQNIKDILLFENKNKYHLSSNIPLTETQQKTITYFYRHMKQENKRRRTKIGERATLKFLEGSVHLTKLDKYLWSFDYDINLHDHNKTSPLSDGNPSPQSLP